MKDSRPPALPPVDIGRLVGDISRTFNPLAREFALDVKALTLPDGLVEVSVVLPPGMTRAYVALLESLTGLVRYVDHSARIAAAESRVVDLDQVEAKLHSHEAYRFRVCRLFDGFVAEGMDRKDAVKATNRALKAEKHPWATFDLVNQTLRAAGKFRERPRGASPKGDSRRSR